jgi:hypothetical protein
VSAVLAGATAILLLVGFYQAAMAPTIISRARP